MMLISRRPTPPQELLTGNSLVVQKLSMMPLKQAQRMVLLKRHLIKDIAKILLMVTLLLHPCTMMDMSTPNQDNLAHLHHHHQASKRRMLKLYLN
jgi:hypothetical protein